MPRLIFLPHEEICPAGAVISTPSGVSICTAALENGIPIEHDCEQSCACTTCHVLVREGSESLSAANEYESEFLYKAWGLEPDSRLSCQTFVGDKDLLIEIPKYTINMVSDVV